MKQINIYIKEAIITNDITEDDILEGVCPELIKHLMKYQEKYNKNNIYISYKRTSKNVDCVPDNVLKMFCDMLTFFIENRKTPLYLKLYVSTNVIGASYSIDPVRFDKDDFIYIDWNPHGLISRYYKYQILASAGSQLSFGFDDKPNTHFKDILSYIK